MPKKTEQTKGTTGLGSLFKRDKTGKRHPANSKVPGIFWIRTLGDNGKYIDSRLLDIDGNPIRDIRSAIQEQKRLRAPFLTGSRIAGLQAQSAELARLRTQETRELEQANPPLAIREAWPEYLRSPARRQCGEGTLRNYAQHWEAFREWLELARPKARFLRDIDGEAAADYARHLTERGLTGNTYNKHFTFLRSFFRLLQRPARLSTNPFADIQRRAQRPQSRRTLSREELSTILQRADGELRALLAIGIYTGLRLGDCCTLEWREVDLRRGVIRRIPRKTAHSSGMVVEIGLTRPLGEALAALPRDGRFVLPEFAERYLSGKSGRAWLDKRFRRHFTACGIEMHAPADGRRVRAAVAVSFHSLRHTWVSLQAEAGTPASLIQKAAGHSNPAMTEHYTHVGETGLRQMARAVDLDFTKEEPTADSRADLLERLAELARIADEEALKRAIETLNIQKNV